MNSFIFKAIILIAVFLIATINELPLPLMGGLYISIIVTYDLITMFKKLSKISKAGFMGLIAASIAITIMFYYKYFISDISITIYHILSLILPPIFIIGFGKKAKEK